ncbi:MAG TPA: hypothetical protein DCS55_02790 [Acidimicrobiaceae bacterium]|nr:hypothetical protein [Acidimicrobiaceae bacterium]
MSSRSLRPSRRKIAASALAATLGLAGLGMVTTPAGAVEPTSSVRVDGPTRYGTAAAISAATFPGGSDDVVLATGQEFADALAGGGLAGELNAPILLTQMDAIPTETAAELDRLDPDTVYIMGGPAAVSASVEAAIEADGMTVERVAGATRYGTATEAASMITTIGETLGNETTAILVNGLRFPDAVASSPAAFALDIPVLLTPADDLNDQTAASLMAEGIERVLIVGGPNAVSEDVATEVAGMGIIVDRFEGATRYETAVDFNSEFLLGELGWDGPEFSLATGETFADALAGGPHAGTIEAPIVLTPTASVATASAGFLVENCNIFDAQVVYGGPAAVTDGIEDAHQAAAQCSTDLDIIPDDAVTLESGSTDTRSYIVTGVAPGTTYDIELFNPALAGPFADLGTDGCADPGLVPADIVAINGVAGSYGTLEEGVTPVNGQIAVTIATDDDADIGYVVPVAYQDEAGSCDGLDINGSGVPTEEFAVGGVTEFLPPEAPNGFSDDVDVFFFDTERNLVAGQDTWGGSYYTLYYDDNDTFEYAEDVPEFPNDFKITQAQFEDYLSIGDEVDFEETNYNQNGDLVVAFEIHDYDADAPTDLNVVVGDFDSGSDTEADDARLTWDAATGGFVYNYFVEVYADDGDDTNACEESAAAPFWTGNTTGLSGAVTIDAEELDDGDYCAVVYTRTVEDDFDLASEASAAVEFSIATGDAPVITSATLTNDAVTEGRVDTGDVWTIVFNENMGTPAGTVDGDEELWLTDADGDTFRIICDNTPVADDDYTSAQCAYGPGTDGDADLFDTLTVTIGEVAEDRNVGGDGVIEYPVTITTAANFTDTEDLTNVSLAGSTDLQIG